MAERWNRPERRQRSARSEGAGSLGPEQGRSYPAQTIPASPKTLEELRAAFIHDKKTTIKKDGTSLHTNTIRSFEVVTRGFLDTIRRTLPSEVSKQDLKDWMMKLRQGDPARKRKAVGHRTVCNLYDSVAAFLMFSGVDHKKLLPQRERPTPVEETPQAYTMQEWSKFMFVITSERDALAFEFLLKAGAREREMTYLEWTDLDLGTNPTVKFQTKQGFRTKTGKSRVVPLERGLAEKLAAWHAGNKASRLVFPTANVEVEGHFLRTMKEYAVVVLNKGNGTFGKPTVYLPWCQTCRTPEACTVADFNLDGKLDVACASDYGDSYLFYGDGKGKVGPAIAIQDTINNESGFSIAAGDVQ